MKPYYEKDGITIYHGDCLDVLPGVRADVCITDPPYGIDHKSNGQLFLEAIPCAGDWDIQLACAAHDIVAPMPTAMFFSPYRPFPIKWRSILVWSKGEQVGIGGDRETCWKRDFELIGVKDNGTLNGRRASAVLYFPADVKKPTGHFCEKPIGLMLYLVSKLSNATDTILDPFAGSGTTLRAAKDLGRKAIGIEIEEKYCEIAAKRMAQGVLDFAGAD